MPVFNDSESIPPFVPEGDYIVRVSALDRGISKGAKTAGCDQWSLELTIEKPIFGRCFDTLIEHEACLWKMDTFLKCMGIKLARGQNYSFDADEAAMSEALHINPLGLRGWVNLTVEEYQGKKKNRVAVYYTDKAKLQRDEPPAKEALPEWDRPKPAVAATAADDDVPF